MDSKSAKNGWQRTRGGLTRYGTKGNYYAYFKVGGKLYRRSLGTDVYTVAKLRLGDVIAEQRALCEEAAGTAAGKRNLRFLIAINSFASLGKSNRPAHRDRRTARTSCVFLLSPVCAKQRRNLSPGPMWIFTVVK